MDRPSFDSNPQYLLSNLRYPPSPPLSTLSQFQFLNHLGISTNLHTHQQPSLPVVSSSSQQPESALSALYLQLVLI